MTPEQYLALVTMHGTIMVFMVLTTAPQSRLRQLLPADSDWRGGHGVSRPQHAVLLDHVRFAGGAGLGVFRYRRRAHRRLDRLSAAERAGRDRRARARRGPERCGSLAWRSSACASLLGALNFITTTVDLRAKGMTLGRMPLTVLGLADHRDPGLAGVRRAARGLHPAAARSHCGNELLHSRRPGGHRSRRSPGTRAARRCCGSTCSGSSAIRRSTSPFFRAWAWRRTCSPRSRASRCSATGDGRRRCAPSASWASACGAITCSSAA